MNSENSPLKILEKQDVDGRPLSFFARIRGYFLAGVLVTAPIAITLYLTYVFLRFVDSKVTHLIPIQYNPNEYLPFSLPGLGLLLVFIFFICVGWFAKNFMGVLIYRFSEYVVHKVPVIRTIYSAIKQIFETIMASQSKAFREVVMLEYPRKGVWSIGFVTGLTKGEVQRTTEEETMSVFVPTTPNPTSGYLLFVPKKELFFLDMSVEEAAKLVVSAGIITPPDKEALSELNSEAKITKDKGSNNNNKKKNGKKASKEKKA
jgi:uncharacterized membrane protein